MNAEGFPILCLFSIFLVETKGGLKEDSFPHIFTIQGICGSGHFTFHPVAITGRRRSYQRLHRITAQMTPKVALEPLASYLDNDHLIPAPLFLSPFSFSVWPSACDKDS